jgi:hypothetical protein
MLAGVGWFEHTCTVASVQATNHTHPAISTHGDHVRVRLKVVPGASSSEVIGPLGDRIKVRVVAPATGGEANMAVVALLRAATGASGCELISGHGSAAKVASLSGVKERVVVDLLTRDR